MSVSKRIILSSLLLQIIQRAASFGGVVHHHHHHHQRPQYLLTAGSSWKAQLPWLQQQEKSIFIYADNYYKSFTLSQRNGRIPLFVSMSKDEEEATTTEEEGEESAASSSSFENIPSSTPRRGTKYSIGLGKNKPVYSSSSSDDDNDYSNENENDDILSVVDNWNIPASVTKPSSTSTTSYPSLLSRPSPKYDLGQGKNQPLQIRKEEVRSKHLLVPDQANEKLSSALWDQTHYTRGDEKNGAVNGKEEETTSSTATTTVLRGIGPPKGDEDVVMPYFQMEEKEEKEEEKKEVKMLNNEKSITVSLPSKEETTETMDDANNDAPPVRFEDIDLSVPPSVYSSSSSADQPKVDLVWDLMRYEAEREAEREPLLVSFLYSTILNHQSLESALAFHLANRIASPNMIGTQIQSLIREALDADPSFRREMRADILAVRDRDPVCTCLPDVFLYFKGFHALQTHRVAHYLWKSGRTVLSHFLQSQVSQHFQIDIHPNATMGSGIMLDHGTGIVIGETAVVGHNCSILHHVTLGGSGKKGVDRHPKVGNGVLLGAGASVLGNVNIGDGCQVGAGTLVIGDLPTGSVAIGVPAKIIGKFIDVSAQPGLGMNQLGSKESDNSIQFQMDGI
mmetsp:Transcript_30741/g.46525  ORF Transcript_30741/g.46525 Transcript_30741/m.46525 type:complete len:622 (+) Transcript_30741:248-2113(+)